MERSIQTLTKSLPRIWIILNKWRSCCYNTDSKILLDYPGKCLVKQSPWAPPNDSSSEYTMAKWWWCLQDLTSVPHEGAKWLLTLSPLTDLEVRLHYTWWKMKPQLLSLRFTAVFAVPETWIQLWNTLFPFLYLWKIPNSIKYNSIVLEKPNLLTWLWQSSPYIYCLVY